MGLRKTAQNMGKNALAKIIRRTEANNTDNIRHYKFRYSLAIDRQQAASIAKQNLAIGG